MRTISRRLRRIEERFAPQENEEVGRLVTLLRERRRRRLEVSGGPLNLGHANALLMIKMGLYRLLTSCGAGVDAPQFVVTS